MRFNWRIGQFVVHPTSYIKLFIFGLCFLFVVVMGLLVFLPPSGIPSHLQCWRANPGLIYLHLISDLMVWSAYSIIPFLVLYVMVRGRIDQSSPISFPALLIWSALFVWSCGLTHLLDAIEIWYQIQWRRGGMKLITGIISWIFVIVLIRQSERVMTVSRAIYRALAAESESAIEDNNQRD